VLFFLSNFNLEGLFLKKKISVLDQGPDGSVSESVKYAARPDEKRSTIAHLYSIRPNPVPYYQGSVGPIPRYSHQQNRTFFFLLFFSSSETEKLKRGKEKKKETKGRL
jgi:hypothetical protein